MAVRRSSWLVAAAKAATTAALGAGLVTGCGGGGGGPEPSRVLFDGTAAELVPHETGRSATFRVTASSGDTVDVSGFTSTVTANEDGGVFVTRYVSDTGALAIGTSRDGGDEIRVERFVDDPGGPDEQVVTPDPPAGVVRTPVVAGEGFDTGFLRTLEMDVRIGQSTVHRSVLFSGTERRIARDRGGVTVPAGAYDAIRYEVHASGRSTFAVLGQTVELAVAVDGDEWFAPGAGGVKEELDVTVEAGDESATVHFATERTAPPPS